MSCSHQGTQAHPSGTKGLFWDLAADAVTGALPGQLSLHGAEWIWWRGSASPTRSREVVRTREGQRPLLPAHCNVGLQQSLHPQTWVHPPGHCAWINSPVLCPYGGHWGGHQALSPLPPTLGQQFPTASLEPHPTP